MSVFGFFHLYFVVIGVVCKGIVLNHFIWLIPIRLNESISLSISSSLYIVIFGFPNGD